MTYKHTLLIIDEQDNGVESLVSQLLEETSDCLDILSTQRFSHLNELQDFLVKMYDVLRYQLELVQKTQVSTRVLYNDGYKDKEDLWDAILVNNQQMENKVHLHIVSHLNYTTHPIIYLFPTLKHHLAVERTSDDTTGYQHYRTLLCGGTFDHLHDGHKILLTISSFICSQVLIVGVTGEQLLVNKKYKEFLESYDTRADAVRQFIKFVAPHLDCQVYEINDVCGPTLYLEDIDALVLSDETAKGGDYVNKVREEKGFKKLQLHRISVVGGGSADDNWQDKLSSTKLRELEYRKSVLDHK